MASPKYKFDLIGGLERAFTGYVTGRDKTAVLPQTLVRGSKNVYKKLSGTIAVRPGLLRRGSADTTLAGVVASYEWQTSLGENRNMRVVNYGAGVAKLQVESDVVTAGTYVWYDLMTSLTLTRFVFDAWWNNTLKKDQLLFVKGDDNIHMWHGGISLIASTTVNTIVLNSTVAGSGFNTASGSVIINGTTYTYSGSSASTLTGVAADPTGETANAIVISAVVTTATSPAAGNTNAFIRVINNRLHVGSYVSRLIYISDDGDYTNFTVPGTRAAGDPELLTLDSTAKGIGVRQGKAHIAAGTSDWYVVSYTPITVGTTLTEQTKVDKKPLAFLHAALAHEFIDNVGDDLIFLDQENQVRIFGDVRNFNQTQFPSLSLPVQDELKELDFTGGALRCIGDIIYITNPINGEDWMHETRQALDIGGDITSDRFWHPPQVRSLARFAVIDGVVYGHSAANPQIYQVWDTAQWHDDSPSDESLNYVAVARFAYRFDKRFNLLTFDKVYWEGYMTTGTALNSKVRFDYQGSTSIQEPSINSPTDPAKFFSGDQGASLGDASLGENPLGDGLTEDSNDQEQLPKFRVITPVQSNDCFEFQLEATSSDPDSRWEILAVGANVQESPRDPAFLMN